MAIPLASRELLLSLPPATRAQAQAIVASDPSLQHISNELATATDALALTQGELAHTPPDQPARRGLILADLDAVNARLELAQGRYHERLLALLTSRFAPAA